MKIKIRWGQVFAHVILLLLLCLMVYPLFMAVWCSFKSTAQFNLTKWYPTLPLNFENVFYAAKELDVYILNTIFVGGAGTLGMLAVSSLAAYAFARMKFYLKNALYAMVIGLMMLPAIMTLVPSFMLYKKLVGTDSYLILILPIITGGSVFGVFLLRGFFEGLNESIFEAAKIDGAGAFRTFWNVVLPSISPTSFYLLVMGVIGALQSFAVTNVLATEGGPNGDGITIVFYLYRRVFSYVGTMGEASASAWFLALMIMLVTAFQFWGSKKWVNYD